MNISATSHRYQSFSSLQVQGRPENDSHSIQKKLAPEEEKQVQELKKRDAEVRRHEQAHKVAAGPNAKGGPTFEYETGPDGKQYAVGGEVQIDTSKIPNDPEATIRKAQVIRNAALAPESPSSQDRKVAAEASKMEAEARKELAELRKEDSNIYNRTGEKEGEDVGSVFNLLI